MSGGYSGYHGPPGYPPNYEGRLNDLFSATPFLKDIAANSNEGLGAYLVSQAVRLEGPDRRPELARFDVRKFYEIAKDVYGLELERAGHRPLSPPDERRRQLAQVPIERFQHLLADVMFEHARRVVQKIPYDRLKDQAPTLENIAEGVDNNSLLPYVKRLTTLACKEQLQWNHVDGSTYSGLFLLYQLVLSITSEVQDAKLYRYLIQLKGREAFDVLNALQLILDFSVHMRDGSDRIVILKALHRLSSNSETYPSVLRHPEIKFTEADRLSGAMGSFGQVYKVNYKGRLLALKVAHQWLSAKTFCKEVVTWCNLSHENVLPFYGVFSDERQFALVSPFMAKGNVRRYLESKYPRVKGPRSTLIADIVSGLEYLHRMGVIHGDLKGDNILVSEDERAYLADFGISTVTTDAHKHLRLTQPSTANAGTNAFQAPELFEYGEGSRLPLSRMSDVYAFACVCYEIMTMKLPLYHIHTPVMVAVLRGDRPLKPLPTEPPMINLGLTEGLWALMEQCWCQEPRERPTAESLLKHPIIFPHLRAASSSYDSGEWTAAQMRQNKIVVGLALPPLVNDQLGSTTSSMYTD